MRPEPCISWCLYEKGTCKFCGWPKDRTTMALRMWDVAMGAARDATQEDIDIMQAKLNAFGRLITEFRQIEGTMTNEIGEIQERYRVSAELSG